MATNVEQVSAGRPEILTLKDFENHNETSVRWMTGAGAYINDFGTNILIDPTLSLHSKDPLTSEVMDDYGTYHLPLFYQPPMESKDFRNIDAILITHSDDDHLGVQSVVELLDSGAQYYGTEYTCNKLIEFGVPADRVSPKKIHERFTINETEVELIPASHPWQQNFPELFDYVFKDEDVCGFKVYCKGGVILHPGDTVLLDSHFENEDVDVLFMDYAAGVGDAAHMGREDSIRLSNALKNAILIPEHWGTFKAPDIAWANCNPSEVEPYIENPERLRILRPGEKLILDSRG